MSTEEKKYFSIDLNFDNLHSLKHELIFIIIGSFNLFLFSPYILNAPDKEYKRTLAIENDDPNITYLVHECENLSIIKNIYDVA